MSSTSSSPCLSLVAGKDLAAGEQVTITYGSMRNDELLMYYGWVLLLLGVVMPGMGAGQVQGA